MTGTIRKNLMEVMLMLAIMIILMLAFTPIARAEDITPSESLAGSGSPDTPFLIASAEDLIYMRDQVNSGGTILLSEPVDDVVTADAITAHYMLTDDIVLGYWQDKNNNDTVDIGEIYDSETGGTAYTDLNWIPIGNATYPFQGTFDGNGHTVSGIYIYITSDQQGLFGSVQGGTIENLGVKNSYIRGQSYVGGIVGDNSGTIQNCYTAGNISASDNVGGIAGNNSGNIQYCYNIGFFQGLFYVGGIAGNNSGTIRFCYNSGRAIGRRDYIGGIAGNNTSGYAFIEYCYNAGSIYRSASGYNVGSVTGYNDSGTVTGCYYDRQISPLGGINKEDTEGAVGKLTCEMTSGNPTTSDGAFLGWSSSVWSFAEGLYPRLAGMDETDAAYVSASPVFLETSEESTETAEKVISDFKVSTENNVVWTSNDTKIISINGNNASVKRNGIVTLTAAHGGTIRNVVLTAARTLSGTGSAEDPFIITTLDELAYMRDQVNSSGTILLSEPIGYPNEVRAETAHYRLDADIVLGYWQDKNNDGIVDDGEIYDSETGGTAYTISNWIPIGNYGYNLKGTFDGNGHTVSGIYINDTDGYRGFFSNTDGGTIKDLIVKDSFIKGVSRIGGIVGQCESGTTIQNCRYIGSISGDSLVGGIAGSNNGNIQHCFNIGSVNGSSYVGGIAGNNYGNGNIQYCFNTGSVSGNALIGGITGDSDRGIIQNCSNTGSVNGSDRVGGVIGNNDFYSSVQYCYNTGSVSGEDNIGSIAGMDRGTITGCYYDRQMSPVGGINKDDTEGAVGKPTSEMTSGAPTASDDVFYGWNSSSWEFTEGLYPRLTGYVNETTDYNIDETDAAYVSASPVFLSETDSVAGVRSDFTLGGTVNAVVWTSSYTNIIGITGGHAALKSDGTVTLTATLGGVSKSVTLTVPDIFPPTLRNAARDSDTQITITLSEPCVNLTKANDGGFMVTKTGTTDTFEVTATEQGEDASQIVLTVESTTPAAITGLTVTYTAGGNGTITDLAENPLATDSTGVVIAPWAPVITATAGIGGSITPSGAVRVNEGDSQTFSITANSGYRISKVSVDGVNQGAISSYTFTDVTDDHTIIVEFTKISSGGSSDTPGQTNKTIPVTETSSNLFKDSNGPIIAKVNISNVFSQPVELKITDAQEDAASFKLSAGDKVFPFDISLFIKGTNKKTKPAPGYMITISLPVPQSLLDEKDLLVIMHKSDSGIVTEIPSRLVQKNGVWYLVFETSDFSPYALVVRYAERYDETAGVPYYIDTDGNKVFIGFAANGKYIAPEGVTVSVILNKKSFTDISGHWAAGSIDFVTEREIFVGTGGGNFSPDLGMTRAMFAAVIGRLYERSYGEIKTSGTHTFTDCDYNTYYGKYIAWASKNGIIYGYGNGRFGPDDQITREQMAVIIYRFADFLGVIPDSIGTVLGYPDGDSISDYAKNAALYCQTTGIISGRKGGVFAPQDTVTRAEVAAIIQRFVEAVLD